MKRKDAYPGSWLKSQDLEGDLTVTIASCEMQEIGTGADADHKPVLKFEGQDKSLVLNQTNWDSIADLHGEDSDDWVGQQITLYVDPRVRFGNKTVPAIRVRPQAPRGNGTAAQQSIVDTWSYKQALAECERRGITQKAMHGFLKVKGFSAYNSVPCTPLLRDWFKKLEPPPTPPGDPDEVILDGEDDPDSPPF